MRLSGLICLFLVLAFSGPPSSEARAAEFRTVSAASPNGPDAAALGEFIEQFYALAQDFQLTPAQQIQVGMTLIGAANQLSSQLEPVAQRRTEIDEMLGSETVDADRLGRLADAQGRAAAELGRLEIDTIIAVRAVLNESQMLMLGELRALLRDRLSDWIGQAGAVAERRLMSRTALRRGGPITGDAINDAAAQMGLTPEQRAIVRTIIEAAAPEFLAIASDVAENRQALGNLARTAPEDGPSINALIDAQANLFEALILLRVDVALQIRGVLTDGQLALIGHLVPVLREQATGWDGDL